MCADIVLSAPQNIFLNVLTTKYRAYVGGYGSGKTMSGCLLLLTFLARNPKVILGYFGTSYASIRDVFFPTLEEAASLMGFTISVRVAVKEVDVYRNGVWYGCIICRSMDRPETIVGFKIAYALVDELDILPRDKALNAWNKIISRMRLVIEGVVNGIGVTTTPEGYKLVYDLFANEPKSNYSMVQASTYENEKYLPEDYIDTLLETYPAELINAYINGEFVNLTAGTVYRSYDKIRHSSSETIQQGEPLLVGMDFNVDKMSAKICVKRNDKLHLVEELDKVYDTPSMINKLKNTYPEHDITVYPDSSGSNRKSVLASTSDVALLRQAKFTVRVNKSNPYVKDRVISVNKAFEDGWLFVNPATAPNASTGLLQQAYDKNGEPDKKSGLDHGNDAIGYIIAYERPVVKPMSHIPVRMWAQ